MIMTTSHNKKTMKKGKI